MQTLAPLAQDCQRLVLAAGLSDTGLLVGVVGGEVWADAGFLLDAPGPFEDSLGPVRVGPRGVHGLEVEGFYGNRAFRIGQVQSLPAAGIEFFPVTNLEGCGAPHQ